MSAFWIIHSLDRENGCVIEWISPARRWRGKEGEKKDQSEQESVLGHVLIKVCPISMTTAHSKTTASQIQKHKIKHALMSDDCEISKWKRSRKRRLKRNVAEEGGRRVADDTVVRKSSWLLKLGWLLPWPWMLPWQLADKSLANSYSDSPQGLMIRRAVEVGCFVYNLY